MSRDSSMYSEEVWASMRSVEKKAADLGIVTGMNGYAELFETIDGKAIEPGYFVTIEGRKIRKISSGDKFVLGVTTIAPAIVGGGGDIRWKDKYLLDKWGRIQFEEVEMPAVLDSNGNVLVPEHKDKRAKINPAFDPTRPYIPRMLRSEWAAVTLLGQVLVRDNGSCRVNGYCIPTDNGIATSSTRGYRVLERKSVDQILILLRSTTIIK